MTRNSQPDDNLFVVSVRAIFQVNVDLLILVSEERSVSNTG